MANLHNTLVDFYFGQQNADMESLMDQIAGCRSLEAFRAIAPSITKEFADTIFARCQDNVQITHHSLRTAFAQAQVVPQEAEFI